MCLPGHKANEAPEKAVLGFPKVMGFLFEGPLAVGLLELLRVDSPGAEAAGVSSNSDTSRGWAGLLPFLHMVALITSGVSVFSGSNGLWGTAGESRDMSALSVGSQTLRRLFFPGPIPELNVYVQ